MENIDKKIEILKRIKEKQEIIKSLKNNMTSVRLTYTDSYSGDMYIYIGNERVIENIRKFVLEEYEAELRFLDIEYKNLD